MMLVFLCFSLCWSFPVPAVVNVPVVDLRGVPQARPAPISWNHDEQQLTQLLFAEPVNVLSQTGSWSFVEAIQQPMLYNSSWSGYRGYVLTSQLLMNTVYPAATLSVVTPYAPIFGRSCILNGCLSSDVVVTVSFGTWLAVVTDDLGWCEVVLPNGKTGFIRR
jgi:hypothetical protein